MKVSQRLRLLLPVANGDQLSEKDLRRKIFHFLQGFQARGLRLPKGEQELFDAHDAPVKELRETARRVRFLFKAAWLFEGSRTGFTPDDIRLPLTFKSLRFGAFRGQPGFIVEGGRLRDLVPYLAMWLLATEDLSVQRCEAPAPKDWTHRCTRFFVPKALGRPSKVCSRECAIRVKNERVFTRDYKAAKRRSRGDKEKKR